MNHPKENDETISTVSSVSLVTTFSVAAQAIFGVRRLDAAFHWLDKSALKLREAIVMQFERGPHILRVIHGRDARATLLIDS